MASHKVNHFDPIVPKISGDTLSRKTTGSGGGNGGGASNRDNDDSHVPRSAKTFVDASVVIASQLDGNVTALEQDGTSPTEGIAVGVSGSDGIGKEISNKTTREQTLSTSESGNSNALFSGITKQNSAKVYAESN